VYRSHLPECGSWAYVVLNVQGISDQCTSSPGATQLGFINPLPLAIAIEIKTEVGKREVLQTPEREHRQDKSPTLWAIAFGTSTDNNVDYEEIQRQFVGEPCPALTQVRTRTTRVLEELVNIKELARICDTDDDDNTDGGAP